MNPKFKAQSDLEEGKEKPAVVVSMKKVFYARVLAGGSLYLLSTSQGEDMRTS